MATKEVSPSDSLELGAALDALIAGTARLITPVAENANEKGHLLNAPTLARVAENTAHQDHQRRSSTGDVVARDSGIRSELHEHELEYSATLLSSSSRDWSSSPRSAGSQSPFLENSKSSASRNYYSKNSEIVKSNLALLTEGLTKAGAQLLREQAQTNHEKPAPAAFASAETATPAQSTNYPAQELQPDRNPVETCAQLGARVRGKTREDTSTRSDLNSRNPPEAGEHLQASLDTTQTLGGRRHYENHNDCAIAGKNQELLEMNQAKLEDARADESDESCSCSLSMDNRADLDSNSASIQEAKKAYEMELARMYSTSSLSNNPFVQADRVKRGGTAGAVVPGREEQSASDAAALLATGECADEMFTTLTGGHSSEERQEPRTSTVTVVDNGITTTAEEMDDEVFPRRSGLALGRKDAIPGRGQDEIENSSSTLEDGGSSSSTYGHNLSSSCASASSAGILEESTSGSCAAPPSEALVFVDHAAAACTTAPTGGNKTATFSSTPNLRTSAYQDELGPPPTTETKMTNPKFLPSKCSPVTSSAESLVPPGSCVYSTAPRHQQQIRVEDIERGTTKESAATTRDAAQLLGEDQELTNTRQQEHGAGSWRTSAGAEPFYQAMPAFEQHLHLVRTIGGKNANSRDEVQQVDEMTSTISRQYAKTTDACSPESDAYRHPPHANADDVAGSSSLSPSELLHGDVDVKFLKKVGPAHRKALDLMLKIRNSGQSGEELHSAVVEEQQENLQDQTFSKNGCGTTSLSQTLPNDETRTASCPNKMQDKDEQLLANGFFAPLGSSMLARADKFVEDLTEEPNSSSTTMLSDLEGEGGPTSMKLGLRQTSADVENYGDTSRSDATTAAGQSHQGQEDQSYITLRSKKLRKECSNEMKYLPETRVKQLLQEVLQESALRCRQLEDEVQTQSAKMQDAIRTWKTQQELMDERLSLLSDQFQNFAVHQRKQSTSLSFAAPIATSGKQDDSFFSGAGDVIGQQKQQQLLLLQGQGVAAPQQGASGPCALSPTSTLSSRSTTSRRANFLSQQHSPNARFPAPKWNAGGPGAGTTLPLMALSSSSSKGGPISPLNGCSYNTSTKPKNLNRSSVQEDEGDSRQALTPEIFVTEKNTPGADAGAAPPLAYSAGASDGSGATTSTTTRAIGPAGGSSSSKQRPVLAELIVEDEVAPPSEAKNKFVGRTNTTKFMGSSASSSSSTTSNGVVPSWNDLFKSRSLDAPIPASVSGTAGIEELAEQSNASGRSAADRPRTSEPAPGGAIALQGEKQKEPLLQSRSLNCVVALPHNFLALPKQAEPQRGMQPPESLLDAVTRHFSPPPTLRKLSPEPPLLRHVSPPPAVKRPPPDASSPFWTARSLHVASTTLPKGPPKLPLGRQKFRNQPHAAGVTAIADVAARHADSAISSGAQQSSPEGGASPRFDGLASRPTTVPATAVRYQFDPQDRRRAEQFISGRRDLDPIIEERSSMGECSPPQFSPLVPMPALIVRDEILPSSAPSSRARSDPPAAVAYPTAAPVPQHLQLEAQPQMAQQKLQITRPVLQTTAAAQLQKNFLYTGSSSSSNAPGPATATGAIAGTMFTTTSIATNLLLRPVVHPPLEEPHGSTVPARAAAGGLALSQLTSAYYAQEAPRFGPEMKPQLEEHEHDAPPADVDHPVDLRQLQPKPMQDPHSSSTQTQDDLHSGAALQSQSMPPSYRNLHTQDHEGTAPSGTNAAMTHGGKGNTTKVTTAGGRTRTTAATKACKTTTTASRKNSSCTSAYNDPSSSRTKNASAGAAGSVLESRSTHAPLSRTTARASARISQHSQRFGSGSRVDPLESVRQLKSAFAAAERSRATYAKESRKREASLRDQSLRRRREVEDAADGGQHGAPALPSRCGPPRQASNPRNHSAVRGRAGAHNYASSSQASKSQSSSVKARPMDGSATTRTTTTSSTLTRNNRERIIAGVLASGSNSGTSRKRRDQQHAEHGGKTSPSASRRSTTTTTRHLPGDILSAAGPSSSIDLSVLAAAADHAAGDGLGRGHADCVITADFDRCPERSSEAVEQCNDYHHYPEEAQAGHDADRLVPPHGFADEEQRTILNPECPSSRQAALASAPEKSIVDDLDSWFFSSRSWKKNRC
ncbi:unnamed protein product [Amoebophrya sp. A120]|nr:unnamed protein product [Amoebophrya sp. A120]|eukprot:GSA120T00004271001.1